MHLGIDPGGGKQALAQLWIKVLGPMGQCGNRRVVTPWVKRRNDAATGPGRFLADVRTVQQHNALYFGGEIECRQQTDYSTADNHHLLLPGHILIQPKNRQRTQKAPEKSTQRPQQSLVVSPSVALTMLRTPVLVMVKSPHLSLAMDVPALRTAVSRKLWSVRVELMV
ncbi:hypothetical protein D3C76_1233360 [compost metagenome]